MARYDVVDEGIIDADCSTVFKAYTDELGGITHWWMPHWESKPRGDDIIVQKGTSRFAARVTEFVKDKLVNVEFF